MPTSAVTDSSHAAANLTAAMPLPLLACDHGPVCFADPGGNLREPSALESAAARSPLAH